jgi:DNA polymerase-3 subunit delta'
VGKELAALGLAAALLCDARTTEGAGCGACDACARVFATTTEEPHLPVHPDVILVGRAIYPEAVVGKKEKQNISVEQIRKVVLSRIPYPPHEGRARIILVRDADELGISAANALLKTLEEPPPRTHFVLLTARAGELIDTIRSRTLPVRFGPLGDTTLRAILVARGVATADIDRVLPLAAGSVSAALLALDPELSQARDAFVESVLEAIRAKDLRPGLALAQTRDKDKDNLRGHLAALATRLAVDARRSVRENRGDEGRLAAQFEIVTRSLNELDENASPQLLLETMVVGLRSIPRLSQPFFLGSSSSRPSVEGGEIGGTCPSPAEGEPINAIGSTAVDRSLGR